MLGWGWVCQPAELSAGRELFGGAASLQSGRPAQRGPQLCPPSGLRALLWQRQGWGPPAAQASVAPGAVPPASLRLAGVRSSRVLAL